MILQEYKILFAKILIPHLPASFDTEKAAAMMENPPENIGGDI